jgi:hypothetical protein
LEAVKMTAMVGLVLMTMFLFSARNVCEFTQVDIIFLSVCR